MPSATAHRPISGRASRLSSLTSRTLPTWVVDPVLKTNGLYIARSFYGFFKQSSRRFENTIASCRASLVDPLSGIEVRPLKNAGQHVGKARWRGKPRNHE